MNTNLQNGEVLEDAVHHVFLRQVLQFVDEVDHVLTHGRTWNTIHEATILEPRILLLYLFDHLLAKRAHFGRASDCHVFVAFIPAGKEAKSQQKLSSQK